MSQRNFGLPTVLVVDDSEVILDVTKTTLEAAGFRVLTHSRPSGCVALILQERPELVLIDVNMPLMSGDAVAKLFGKALPGSDIIVLLHSTLPADVLELKAKASGAHGYIRKTGDAYDFVRQVNHWLKRGPSLGGGLSSSKLRSAPRIDLSEIEAPSGAHRTSRSLSPLLEGTPDSASGYEKVSGVTRVALPLVLFIDDDMETLSSLRREVQSEPYTTEFALSGAQALRKILSPNAPDLVVSDLLMPAPGGAEVLREAMNADRAWQGRFVFLTGASIVPEISSFVRQFPGIVLSKPVDGNRLRSVIREHLSARSAPSVARSR
ncbi:MAG: response regulator [Myxococcota bacterium]